MAEGSCDNRVFVLLCALVVVVASVNNEVVWLESDDGGSLAGSSGVQRLSSGQTRAALATDSG